MDMHGVHLPEFTYCILAYWNLKDTDERWEKLGGSECFSRRRETNFLEIVYE